MIVASTVSIHKGTRSVYQNCALSSLSGDDSRGGCPRGRKSESKWPNTANDGKEEDNSEIIRITQPSDVTPCQQGWRSPLQGSDWTYLPYHGPSSWASRYSGSGTHVSPMEVHGFTWILAGALCQGLHTRGTASSCWNTGLEVRVLWNRPIVAQVAWLDIQKARFEVPGENKSAILEGCGSEAQEIFDLGSK